MISAKVKQSWTSRKRTARLKETDVAEKRPLSQYIWFSVFVNAFVQGNWKGVKPYTVFWVLHIRLQWSLPPCRYAHSQQTRCSPWANPEGKGQTVSEEDSALAGTTLQVQGKSSSEQMLIWTDSVLSFQTHTHTHTHTQNPCSMLLEGNLINYCLSASLTQQQLLLSPSLFFLVDAQLFNWTSTFILNNEV